MVKSARMLARMLARTVVVKVLAVLEVQVVLVKMMVVVQVVVAAPTTMLQVVMVAEMAVAAEPGTVVPRPLRMTTPAGFLLHRLQRDEY